MFLSRLVLEPRHWAVRRDLGDCHQMHRTILSAFGKIDEGRTGARSAFGVLFRVDEERQQTVVYVQSREMPSWEHLPDGYLDAACDRPGGNPAVRPLDRVLDSLASGQTLRFRLLANATRKIRPPGSDGKVRENGTRVPLRDESARLGWLRRKAAGAGFELLQGSASNGVHDVRESTGRRVSGRKGEGATALRVDLEGVLFDGRLRVVDPQLFRKALTEGIGPGKAFGFGLLSLAPAQ